MAPGDPPFDVGTVGTGTVDDDSGGLDPAALRSLTEPQREAVLATDPLLCVLAGAGAGKTRVLTLRVARRIGDGSADGDRTLVCTFTRKAATELRDRLWRLGASSGVTAGTIHRTALRILQQHRADHRLAPVVVLADRRALVAEAVGRGDGARALPVPRVEAEIGWAKATLLRPDGYAAGVRAAGRRVAVPVPAVVEAYTKYEVLRRRRGVLDLDDLLVTCADVLSDDVSFASAVRWRYRHLYVDEMQDVNPAQFRLLCSLLGDEPDLFVVGDPNQSVYGWNGADPSLLSSFPSVFPGTRVVRLDQNHRSSSHVVSAAAAALGVSVLEGADGARAPGPLPEVVGFDGDGDEASWVARRIWRDHPPGSSWSRVAVLSRTNAQLPLVAAALERERVPFVIAGADMGPASDVGRGSGVGGSAADDAAAEVLDIHDAADDGADDADENATVDVTVGGADRKWVAEDALPARGVPGDGVVLSTFHKAKGLEWSSVFVIGLSEGLVPLASARSEAAQAEERRLLYVAMTRAEERLHLSWARRADDGGNERKRCRWLDPVSEVLAEMAAATAPTDPAETVARLAALRAELAARSAARAAARAADPR